MVVNAFCTMISPPFCVLQVLTSSVCPDGLQFMLGGGLSFRRGRSIHAVACVVAAAQARGQGAAERPPEQGAGEDVDDWVQGGVQEVQPQRHNVELGEGVEGGAVLRAV